jgi:hypothetical protein
LSDQEIARFFGVEPETINDWDVAHPEFSRLRAGARDLADADVAARLYQRAMGYSHEDVHIAVSAGEVHKTATVKHYPPDTDAARWWLKNRQPARWRDRQEIEASGSIGLGVIAVPMKAAITE